MSTFGRAVLLAAAAAAAVYTAVQLFSPHGFAAKFRSRGIRNISEKISEQLTGTDGSDCVPDF